MKIDEKIDRIEGEQDDPALGQKIQVKCLME